MNEHESELGGDTRDSLQLATDFVDQELLELYAQSGVIEDGPETTYTRDELFSCMRGAWAFGLRKGIQLLDEPEDSWERQQLAEIIKRDTGS